MEHLTNEEIILAGVGGTSPRSSNIKMDIGASKYRKHFIERVRLLPKNIQSALKSHKAQIEDAPFYATAELTGTRTELIKLSTPEEITITNIDNGKLGKDQHLTLSAIKLLYDAKSIEGSFTDPFPRELLNGEWELILNGKKVFRKQQIRNFHDGFYGYQVNKPFGLYELDNPKQISPQTPIEFNLNTKRPAEGFVKVSFEGTVVSTF